MSDARQTDGSDASPASSGQDITALQARIDQLESQLRAKEEAGSFDRLLLRTIVEHCPFRIYAKDRTSRFIFGNMEVAKVMGVASPEQLMGKTDFDFYPQSLAQLYFDDEQALLRSGVPLIGREEPVIDQLTGEPGWTLTSKVHLRDDDGEVIGLLGLGFNISERKRLEMELVQRNVDLTEANNALSHAAKQLIHAEKLAALGSLVAGVAHELNTPIGNSVMASTALADQTGEFVKVCSHGLTRAALEAYIENSVLASDILVRNLRRAAKLIESFKQVAVDQTSAQRRRFALSATVAEIIMAMSPLLNKAHIEVRQTIPAELIMDSFPGPLGQVLINLIYNAMVHGFEGRDAGTIVISAVGDGDAVVLRFEDDGVGIPAENLPRIFDPFFTTKRGVGGSGLGLNIVHNIATGMLGGEIDVSSSVGAGTCFVLRVPLVAPHKAAAPA